MTLIIQNENPAEFAPRIFYNHCGLMPWSGRHASAFTGLELIDLFRFCEEEGHRQGSIDANQDRIGTREEAPFHQDFMGGYPKQLWESAYWEGVDELSDTTSEAINMEVQEVLNDPEASCWLRDALTSAMTRDPGEALDDAKYLSDVLMRRCNATAMGNSEPLTPQELF